MRLIDTIKYVRPLYLSEVPPKFTARISLIVNFDISCIVRKSCSFTYMHDCIAVCYRNNVDIIPISITVCLTMHIT